MNFGSFTDEVTVWKKGTVDDYVTKLKADQYSTKYVAKPMIPTKEAMEACIDVNDHFDKELYGEIQYVVELSYSHPSWGIFLQKKYVYTNLGIGPEQTSRRACLDSAKHAFLILIEDEYRKKEEEKNMAIKNFVMEKIEQPKHTTIKDITVYNDKVVKMDFSDGTFVKAVCGEHDEFNLDTGITICLVKKMLGGQEDGTRCYNNLLRDLHGLMKDKEKAKIEEAEEKERQKQKRKKHELKRAKKKLLAEQAQIDIQKTAFAMALRECGLSKEDDLK